MDLEKLLFSKNEKPLDNLVWDGGYARVFRTIGCIGDSLSSGEHESRMDGETGYHDYYEYSWGQYMARNAGINVFNFSRGGMTARQFMEGFGEKCGVWTDAKKCQAYILALGVNEVYQNQELGELSDVDPEHPENNKDTFVGNYAKIISKLKTIEPDAKFFLITIPRGELGEQGDRHAELLYGLKDMFENTYIIDLRKYGPEYNSEFKKRFYVGGHMSAAGYILSAQMITSYLDYIVRHNIEDFAQAGFIGTPYKFI